MKTSISEFLRKQNNVALRILDFLLIRTVVLLKMMSSLPHLNHFFMLCPNYIFMQLDKNKPHDILQTKMCHANANADGIRNKNNMPPPHPFPVQGYIIRTIRYSHDSRLFKLIYMMLLVPKENDVFYMDLETL